MRGQRPVNAMPFATVTPPGKSVRYRTVGAERERYETLESLEIKPHARDARDARAFIIACNARRGIIPLARYRRGPAPILEETI